MATWTVGVFTVTPGREEDFLRMLTEVEPSMAGVVHAPKVLRDRESPNVFVTMTPWESIEAIDAFRNGRMRELMETNADVLQNWEPRTLDEITPRG
jgi:heme-degrading monooxygenase HmoA